MKNVTITTDGACHPNPGRGGWAAILRYADAVREISGSEEGVTNNRMELMAIVQALRVLKEPCLIVVRTDSNTAIAWCRPGSFATPKSRAKHPHIWPLVNTYRQLAAKHQIAFTWVEGHSGDCDNERCDFLARKARAVFPGMRAGGSGLSASTVHPLQGELGLA